jgi:lipoprotein-releasing system ATP-binding protein
MIKAKKLSKTYGSLAVLNDVDIQVKTKEIVTITGPSGAGKTTLLNILGTLDVADNQSGRKLEISGQDVFALQGKELAKFRNQHLGFVFQSHQLLPEFSAIENVCIPAMIGKTPLQKAQKEAMELLGFLGLAKRADHKPAMLSGGEQQRVAVARALINKPKLLLADEPSGNLDSKTANQLHKLFLSLRDNFDQTIVLVTHNIELAALGDRSLQLVDGQWS